MPYDYKNSSISDDREAALKVEARADERLAKFEKDNDRQSTHPQQDSAQADANGEDENEAAVRTLQHHYREYVDRRSNEGRNLTASQRWADGIQGKKLARAGKEQADGKNDSKSRWKRTELYAAQVSSGKNGPKEEAGADLSSGEEMDKFAKNDKERDQIAAERKVSKQMEHQYWLEMCDAKHRYGTNLKWYHKQWNESDTKDNFFHWLDEGEGKDVDCEQCPRHRLEKERITYLNAEQRQKYLVHVKDGKLVWAKNGEPLDCTKYYRDAGPEEGGIVKMTEEEYRDKVAKEKEAKKQRRANLGKEPESSSSSSSSSDEEDSLQEADQDRQGVKGYSDKGGTAMQGKGPSQFKARMKYYLSPRAVTDRLLRDTISKNTWLFVSDMQNNLYVGLKQTGRFQHSSFLYGGRVTAAGLIKAEEGQLTSLSPLSGHYRAGTMHFKAFVRSLEERGCDMSKVSISKAVTTIAALEKYAKANKKKTSLKHAFKTKLGLHSETAEEQAQKQDAEDKDKITKDEQAKPIDAVKKEHEHNKEDDALPGDGKKVEEMTEEERMERGLALIARAWDRSLQDRVEKAEKKAKKGEKEEDKPEELQEGDKKPESK